MTHNDDSWFTPEQLFGAQVKDARETRGWSQEVLARNLKEATGMELHQTGLARLERGKRPIRLDEAVALCAVLGLSLGSYAQPVALLTQQDYEKARKEIDGILAAEKALKARLTELRVTRDEEIAETERSLQSWRDQRLQLEASIQAWAVRQSAEHRVDDEVEG